MNCKLANRDLLLFCVLDFIPFERRDVRNLKVSFSFFDYSTITPYYYESCRVDASRFIDQMKCERERNRNIRDLHILISKTDL